MFRAVLAVWGAASFKVVIDWGIFQYFKKGVSKRGHQTPMPIIYCVECFVSQKNMVAILSCIFCIIKNLLAI